MIAMRCCGNCLLVVLLGLLVVACDDDDDENANGNGDTDNLEDVGQPCEDVDDCYPDVNHDDLAGDVVCLDKVEDGYCTHYCVDDADCCAVEGECDEEEVDLEYVCGPFESTGERYCFISCEGEDDGDGYCQQYAHAEFICRSTGGGSENRKVCVPEG